ncbi:MAG: DsbA family protein, partial [Pseudomonadota bacterium]
QENKGEIFDDGWSYVGGNPDGDVTIVEFLDYRCGFCKRAFPAVEELVASDGNIRLIVKEFPILGPASDLAARYAMATKRIEGDDAYKSVHDTMMGLKADLNERTLAMLSAEFDLNHEAIMAEMETDAVRDAIAANRALGARLSINGTPSFIMGENFVRGFVELEQMRAIVEDIRAEQS